MLAVEPTPTVSAESIGRMVVRYGLGAIISLWLTYQLSANIPIIRQELEAHSRVTAFYLHAMCLNTAATEAQARGCELPRGTDDH